MPLLALEAFQPFRNSELITHEEYKLGMFYVFIAGTETTGLPLKFNVKLFLGSKRVSDGFESLLSSVCLQTYINIET